MVVTRYGAHNKQTNEHIKRRPRDKFARSIRRLHPSYHAPTTIMGGEQKKRRRNTGHGVESTPPSPRCPLFCYHKADADAEPTLSLQSQIIQRRHHDSCPDNSQSGSGDKTGNSKKKGGKLQHAHIRKLSSRERKIRRHLFLRKSTTATLPILSRLHWVMASSFATLPIASYAFTT